MAGKAANGNSDSSQNGSDADAANEGSAASAADKVAETILRGIRAGTFVPGQHLLEPDLTRRFNISRGSLREALKHLAADGIVTLNRFRGAYIATLDSKSIHDLLQTLEPLARLAGRLAAENCDSEDKRQRMSAAASAVEEASRSRHRADYLDQRRNFYSTLVDIGGNRELERVMPLSRTDVFRAQVETIQTEKQRKRHASGYGRIARAVLDRNPAAADRAVRNHFAGTTKTMMELPKDAFPEMDG
jgi:DNA-binding GntR family transcriptional regulator